MFSGAAGRIYTIESPGLRGSRLEWFEQWLNQDTYSRGGSSMAARVILACAVWVMACEAGKVRLVGEELEEGWQ